MKITGFFLAVMVMAGLGYWNWQKGQVQLQALQNQGFMLTDDLRGQPRLVIDNRQQQIAIVTPHSYRIIPMSAILSSDVKFDRGVQMDQNFRIQLQLSVSKKPLEPIVYENEALARAALEKLHAALRQTAL